MTHRCQTTIFFVSRQTSKTTNDEFYFGGLDLQYRTPEMSFPSCETEKDNFKVSQGRKIRTKNKEFFKSKVLKQKQHCVAAAVVVS